MTKGHNRCAWVGNLYQDMLDGFENGKNPFLIVKLSSTPDKTICNITAKRRAFPLVFCSGHQRHDIQMGMQQRGAVTYRRFYVPLPWWVKRGQQFTGELTRSLGIIKRTAAIVLGVLSNDNNERIMKVCDELCRAYRRSASLFVWQIGSGSRFVGRLPPFICKFAF